MWQISDGALLHTLKRPDANIISGIGSIVFSPDGQLLAASSVGETVVAIWQVSDGALLRTFSDYQNAKLINFSPDGQTLAAFSSRDGTLSLWRVNEGALIAFLPITQIDGLAFSPDGQTLVTTSSFYKLLNFWQVSDGTLTGKLDTDAHQVAYSPDGQIMAAASTKAIGLWQVSDGAILQAIEQGIDLEGDIIFGANGKTLISAPGDDRVMIYSSE